MIEYIGRTVLLVREYDEALAFYRQKLGFETIFDDRLGNGFRAVHIGLPTQPGVGIWLMESRSESDRERIGKQAGDGPFLVMYTGDCRAATERLRANGVEILREPKEEPGSVSSHFADLYGNEFVLVELVPSAT